MVHVAAKMDATVLLCMLSAVARVLFCVCLSVLRGFYCIAIWFLGCPSVSSRVQ